MDKLGPADQSGWKISSLCLVTRVNHSTKGSDSPKGTDHSARQLFTRIWVKHCSPFFSWQALIARVVEPELEAFTLRIASGTSWDPTCADVQVLWCCRNGWTWCPNIRPNWSPQKRFWCTGSCTSESCWICKTKAHVLSGWDVFQIVQSIIQRIAVLVMNLPRFVTWRKAMEHEFHDTMDTKPMPSDPHDSVSRWMQVSLWNGPMRVAIPSERTHLPMWPLYCLNCEVPKRWKA